jgi:hypothetical protein
VQRCREEARGFRSPATTRKSTLHGAGVLAQTVEFTGERTGLATFAETAGRRPKAGAALCLLERGGPSSELAPRRSTAASCSAPRRRSGAGTTGDRSCRSSEAGTSPVAPLAIGPTGKAAICFWDERGSGRLCRTQAWPSARYSHTTSAMLASVGILALWCGRACSDLSRLSSMVDAWGHAISVG